MKTRRIIFYSLLAISFLIVMLGFYLGTLQGLNTTSAKFIAIGRITGIIATFAVLIEVLILSRMPFIEKNFNLEQIIQLHRYNGFVIIFAIVAHAVFITYGYALQTSSGLLSQFLSLNTDFEDVLYATIGTVIFFAITVTSIKFLRKKIPYEIWFFTHVLVYGAILLASLHQLNSGFDFVTQDWLKYYWIFLYVAVFGLLAWYRFIRPIYYVSRYDFKVLKIAKESNSIFSIYITGNNVDRLEYESGQYAVFRFLSKGFWYESHPFSFSVNRNSNYLRISFKKTSGDFTNKMPSIQPGSRVLIDGPRGAFIANRCASKVVYLIAGGVGITPFRAMIPDFIKKNKKVVLIYSAESIREMAYYSYFKQLNDQKEITLIAYETNKNNYLNTDLLKKIYGVNTSISNTYICGPEPMMISVKKSLNELGIQKSQIFTEEFKF
jgi:predicted ferric reductase